MTKIIMLCGEKQSGKSSAGEFIYNSYMTNNNFPFEIKDQRIEITEYIQGEFTVESKKRLVAIYSNDVVDRFLLKPALEKCKIYNFADSLKSSVSELFGVSLDLLYGSDDDKGLPTHITWSAFSNFLNDVNLKRKIKELNLYDVTLTIRELMQYFATICRKLDPNCFANGCLSRIKRDKPEVAIICDCRFVNELDVFENEDIIPIRLIKANKEEHESEQLHLIDQNKFKLIIDTSITTKDQKNQLIYGYLNANNIL